MKRIKEFFVKLFGCKTPKELVVDPVAVKEPELVEVVNESPEEELNDKLVKLYEFGSTEKFKELDPVHKQLLVIQSGAMMTYNETLKLRLGLL